MTIEHHPESNCAGIVSMYPFTGGRESRQVASERGAYGLLKMFSLHLH